MWAEQEMGNIDLGDRRRMIRLCEFLNKASQNFQASVSQLSKDQHTRKAYYRLIENPKLDKNIVLEEHIKAVQLRAKEHDTVLCIQDTTELDYSTKSSIKGLGRLNYEARQGMYLHPTLMITPEGVPLGITDMWSWARKAKDEPDIKESLRWKEGYERVCELAEDNPETHYVYIADREGDLHDIIELAEQKQCPADYLIRAKHSRLLQDGSKLFDITKAENILGQIEFTVSSGRGKPSRKVTQTIYSKRVQLKSGFWITIIIAKENNPPKGSTAVIWRLLSNRIVNELDEASQLIDWYRHSWQIEILFNILKTGCLIEERQFNSIDKLEKLFLLYLLISYRILLVTMLSRELPDSSCEVLFDREEWHVAYKLYYEKKPPTKPPKLKQMVSIIAQLGGHMGRKGDGDPGVKTIWRGLMLVQTSLHMVNILTKTNN
ncbi:IS4 family transposase [Acinetobacter larvae]|uniref:IS4 family transposase n=1 Tax=Acinetobacter larvae TaxID=1789224 RepID=A0A1B2M140_9GAMM|nr:IS4 family transposase [Acinetobacter larvae]AOA58914.1 hypothetical protein BFG52_11495 [Acinetobacter larvae]